MSTGPEDSENAGSTSGKPGSSWFDRVLWLGPRVAEARAATFRPGQPGFDLYDIARQIRDETSRIARAGRGTWVVLLFDCVAVELLVRAHLARADQSAGTAPLGEADWARVQQLPRLEAAWGKFSSAHMPTLMAVAGADRVATVARLADEERKSFAHHLHELVQDLTEPLEFEANRLGWAIFSRWSRMALAALLLAAVFAYAAARVHAKTHPNLALGRPVTASSLNGYGPDPNLLTDGITDAIAFHTNGGEQQWVVIDLGEVKKFDKIVVYNRPGCCAERAVPLKVEVSNDNQNYRQIAERIETFNKWAANNLNAEGRYVRLKNTPPNFFHLAEVEIY
jgi:hypothetical protein